MRDRTRRRGTRYKGWKVVTRERFSLFEVCIISLTFCLMRHTLYRAYRNWKYTKIAYRPTIDMFDGEKVKCPSQYATAPHSVSNLFPNHTICWTAVNIFVNLMSYHNVKLSVCLTNDTLGAKWETLETLLILRRKSPRIKWDSIRNLNFCVCVCVLETVDKMFLDLLVFGHIDKKRLFEINFFESF